MMISKSGHKSAPLALLIPNSKRYVEYILDLSLKLWPLPPSIVSLFIAERQKQAQQYR